MAAETSRAGTKSASRYRQRGSAAIEFALLFIPVFALFYAILSYGFVFMLLQSFGSAAEGGARAAIAIDPSAFDDTADYLNNGVIPEVREQVAQQLDWLPSGVKDKVLGAGNQHVAVTLDEQVLRVIVGYQDYTASPVLPLLELPGIGQVPRVPSRLVGSASIRL